jgi:hypothetical protein
MPWAGTAGAGLCAESRFGNNRVGSAGPDTAVPSPMREHAKQVAKIREATSNGCESTDSFSS